MEKDTATLLDDLMIWAETQGVALTLFEIEENVWEINHIAREEGAPPGTGKSVLMRLSQEADIRHCTVLLAVMGSNSALEALYAEFNFVADGKRDLDTGNLMMKRIPMLINLEPRKRPHLR